MPDTPDYRFEVFISYSTTPDYSLARNLESFLETFNKLPTPENLSLTPLRICVDGSDFQAAKRIGKGREVASTLDDYLGKSKELLVLCSRNAHKSKWVDQEIRWFLTNREPESIRLAITEGEELSKFEEIFPPAIVEKGLHKQIAYDLRGFNKHLRQKAQALRDFDDERTRLAADLYGKSASEIAPIWFREQRRQSRKRTRIFIIVTCVLLALLAGAIYFYLVAEAERKRTLAESERTRRQFYVASMNLAQRALNEGSVPLARQTLEAQQPAEGQEDLRDFDWSYLWRRVNAEKSSLVAKDIFLDTVSVSFDGSLVAAGGSSGHVKTGEENPSHSVYVWSLQGKELKYLLKGHTDSVAVVKFSPTAPVLASAGLDGVLKIWNAETGTEIRSFKIAVQSLAYSADGKILAVSDGGKIHLFNTATWESAGALVVNLEQSTVSAMTFSPDGQSLAVGELSKKVSLWDVGKRKLIEVLVEHQAPVLSIAWSAHSNVLATGSADGVVSLWDMNEKKHRGDLGLEDGAASLAFTRDGKLLAGGLGSPRNELGSGKTIVLWDVATATRVGLIKGHPWPINSLEFTPSGDSLVSAGQEETIRIWDVQTSSFLKYFRGNGVWPTVLNYSPDGKMLAAGDLNGLIGLRNLESGALLDLGGHENHVTDLSFDPANRLLASAAWDGTLRLWQLGSTSESQVLLQAGHFMNAIAFAPDGSKLAAANCDGNIYLWDAPSLKSLLGLKQTGCASFLTWSPDSQHFATGGGNTENKDSPRSVFLWRVGAANAIKILEGHSSWPTKASFSPDGKYLVTGSWDGEMILWDLASGTVRHRMRGHTGSVTAVMFSPSGRIIASSGDKTVRLWDTETGQERALLTNQQPFTAMRFHPSGQILAAGGEDGFIVQWIAKDLRP